MSSGYPDVKFANARLEAQQVPTVLISGTQVFNSAADQIVLGGIDHSNTITLDFNRPSASRVYTIPDAGEDSSVLFSNFLGGPQIISGPVSFTTPIQAPGLHPAGELQYNVVSIAELRSNTNANIKSAIVAGYYTYSDGGGGVFASVTGSSAADDGGSVVVDLAGLRWYRRYNLINARHFGAKGDGVTDDTVAVQNLLQFASANQTAAYFTIGMYVVTSPIVLASNTHIVIEGANIRLFATGTVPAYSNGSLFVQSSYSAPINNVSIRGGTLSSIASAPPVVYTATGALIKLYVNNFAVRRVTLNSQYSSGLILRGADICLDYVTIKCLFGDGLEYLGGTCFRAANIDVSVSSPSTSKGGIPFSILSGDVHYANMGGENTVSFLLSKVMLHSGAIALNIVNTSASGVLASKIRGSAGALLNISTNSSSWVIQDVDVTQSQIVLDSTNAVPPVNIAVNPLGTINRVTLRDVSLGNVGQYYVGPAVSIVGTSATACPTNMFLSEIYLGLSATTMADSTGMPGSYIYWNFCADSRIEKVQTTTNGTSSYTTPFVNMSNLSRCSLTKSSFGCLSNFQTAIVFGSCTNCLVSNLVLSTAQGATCATIADFGTGCSYTAVRNLDLSGFATSPTLQPTVNNWTNGANNAFSVSRGSNLSDQTVIVPSASSIAYKDQAYHWSLTENPTDPSWRGRISTIAAPPNADYGTPTLVLYMAQSSGTISIEDTTGNINLHTNFTGSPNDLLQIQWSPVFQQWYELFRQNVASNT